MGIRIIKLLAIFAVLCSAMVTAGGTTAVAAPEDQVTVCHKPGTPAEQELTMNGNALDAHLNHGDVEGPCGPPPQACDTSTLSGGEGVTTTVHELGVAGSTSFLFQWEAYSVPDQFEVIYEGVEIYDTGVVGDDINEGTGSATVAVPAGGSTQVTVVVTGPFGTAWDYTVNCPAT